VGYNRLESAASKRSPDGAEQNPGGIDASRKIRELIGVAIIDILEATMKRPSILSTAFLVTAACVFVLALTVLPTHAQTCAPRPAGLIAWWPLNEQTGTTVLDIVGGHNGTTFNASPIGAGPAALAAIKANTWNGGPVSVPGKVGNALQFGFNIYAQVPNANATDLNFGTGDFTIDAWIKLYHYNSAVGQRIVLKHDAYTGYVLQLGKNLLNGQTNLVLSIGDGTNGGSLNYDGPDITAPLETWIFVAVVRSGKTVTLYANSTGTTLNSVPVTYNSNPLPIASSTNALWIGWESDLAIDEVEIFNRPLAPSEIQGIFNAGSAGKCGPTKGMTWRLEAVNSIDGTVEVGCGVSNPNPCNASIGDQLCTASLPLLCIYMPQPAFPVPQSVNDTDLYNRWSGAIVGTTAPVPASSFNSLAQANARCEQEFDPKGTGSTKWRVAEFHDGANGRGIWNFQAYGNVGNPASRFWVHINDQKNATCWSP
jgi:hypothetical protein